MISLVNGSLFCDGMGKPNVYSLDNTISPAPIHWKIQSVIDASENESNKENKGKYKIKLKQIRDPIKEALTKIGGNNNNTVSFDEIINVLSDINNDPEIKTIACIKKGNIFSIPFNSITKRKQRLEEELTLKGCYKINECYTLSLQKQQLIMCPRIPLSTRAPRNGPPRWLRYKYAGIKEEDIDVVEFKDNEVCCIYVDITDTNACEDEVKFSYPVVRYLCDCSNKNKIVIEWCFPGKTCMNENGATSITRAYLISNLLYKYDESNGLSEKQQNVFQLTEWKRYDTTQIVDQSGDQYHPFHTWFYRKCGIYRCLRIQDILNKAYKSWNWPQEGLIRAQLYCGLNFDIMTMDGYVIEHTNNLLCELKTFVAQYCGSKLNGWYCCWDDERGWLYLIMDGNEVFTLVYKKNEDINVDTVYEWRVHEKSIIANLPKNVNADYNVNFLNDFWVITASADVTADHIGDGAKKWIVQRDWSIAYAFNTDIKAFVVLHM